MFCRASTLLPSAETKHLARLRTAIFSFLASMLHRFQVRAGDARASGGQSRSRLAPGEEPLFQESEQKPEEEGRNSYGEDSGIYPFKVEHFSSRLYHVADAFSRVDHFRQDHIGPADIVEDAERREDRRKGGTKHQPQGMAPFGAKRVGRLQQ